MNKKFKEARHDLLPMFNVPIKNQFVCDFIYEEDILYIPKMKDRVVIKSL